MEKQDGQLIVTLANLFLGKQVRSDVVREALELICGRFHFDCGMVYEIDQFNTFHLKERYASREAPACDSFSAEQIVPEFQISAADQPVFCFQKSDGNTPFEELLLREFSAGTMAVRPLLEENMRAFGLIVFMNAEQSAPLDKEAEEALSVPLSMLGCYVGVRIHQNRLNFLQNSLESILDNTGIDIYVNDFYTHEILYANKSMAAPYGGISAFMGRKCWEVLFPGQGGPCAFCPQKKITDENGNPTKVYTWNYQRPFDGSWFRVFSTAFRWVDGRLAHMVSSADITENKRNEEMIQYLANYDSLTGLPNRRMLVLECENRINRATENEQGYVMYFDIDDFKAINDTLGHDAGDEFLVKLGEFFSGIPLLQNSIYRNGGDEFVAVLGGEQVTKLNIQNLVHFIHARFQKPWELKKGDVTSNVSVGVACYPEDGREAEPLLRKADQAMYQVKKSGGGGLCFGYELP